ncbi:MAG: hypothetical protein NTX50_21270 [Candidatus Sumerlaeota bacterium]|nr:hypothetical protein [Candidatus Sumerlaeota bacterium]
MSSTAAATLAKMVESLPESKQEQAVEHFREYLEEMQQEMQWDELFQKTQPQLVTAARRAKQEIAAGLAKPFDYGKL